MMKSPIALLLLLAGSSLACPYLDRLKKAGGGAAEDVQLPENHPPIPRQEQNKEL